MKIQINKLQKIELLRAIKTGVFNTETFPELIGLEPARTLTKEEAKEYLDQIEKDC